MTVSHEPSTKTEREKERERERERNNYRGRDRNEVVNDNSEPRTLHKEAHSMNPLCHQRKPHL
jgi:hypothetical protein